MKVKDLIILIGIIGIVLDDDCSDSYPVTGFSAYY